VSLPARRNSLAIARQILPERVEERVKSRFFLAIDFTRPYSDFDFGCGKFFLPRNSDADERVAGEVR